MELSLIENFIWPFVFLIFVIFFVFLFRKEISEFIKEIGWLKIKWFELRRIREDIFAKAEEVKKLSEELNKDKQELREATKVFIETFYLSLETRNRFPIPEKISQKIIENLNILANFAIENESEGEEWMEKIQELLSQELKK